MQFKGRLKEVNRDWKSGTYAITFEMTEGTIESVNGIQNTTLDIKAVKWRNKRSLDANAYAWVLLQKIAEAIKSTKEDVYLEMLKKYSRSFTHIIVKPNAIEAVKQAYRTTVDLGEITVNGMTGHQLQVYFGSSTFDTKEMSIFIDGIVSEAKELGIETETPAEIERIKALWNQ